VLQTPITKLPPPGHNIVAGGLSRPDSGKQAKYDVNAARPGVAVHAHLLVKDQIADRRSLEVSGKSYSIHPFGQFA
jgi:hypothetical protein